MGKMIYLLAAFSLTTAIATPAVSQTLERIRETGQLNLGYRTDAAPLSFRNKAGEPAGYSPLLCGGVALAIAEHLQMRDLNARFVEVDAANRFEKVASGEIDLLCGAATITLRRLEIVDFSVPTYIDGTAVMLPAGADPNPAALIGKKLGVRDSTTTKDALQNTLTGEGVEAEIVTFASHQDGLEAIERGDIDAYFADQSILLFLYLASDNKDKLMVGDDILTVEKQGLAMARGDADFRLVVDTALSNMFASGDVERIYLKALPGVEPGSAIRAMFLTSPILP